MEEWKCLDFIGYGKYAVSDLGNVKSLKYNKERIIKPIRAGKGYYQVFLYKNCNYDRFYIHRLVALAFIPNPDGKSDVDHIDGIKTNNNVSNLRWTSHKENTNNLVTLPNIWKNRLRHWRLENGKRVWY